MPPGNARRNDMSQNTELYIPFPPRISLDVEGAAERQLIWPRAHGLVHGEAAEKRVTGWLLAELSACFHPQATGDNLDLGTHQQTFFFLFDDQFDGADDQSPPQALALARELIFLTQEPRGSQPRYPSPLGYAFAHLWQLSTDGMSQHWCDRAGRDWAAYFNGYLIEADERRHGGYMDLNAYLKMRQLSIGVGPVINLEERISGHEVPPRIMGSPLLQEMRSSTDLVVILANDVQSLAKEAERGDKHNTVLILQHQHGCSQEEAIARLQGMVRDHIERFLQQEAEVPALLDRLAATPSERHATETFITDGLRACMRGTYDWGRRNARYAPEGVIPRGTPQYMENLV
jgi:hypothetical protein